MVLKFGSCDLTDVPSHQEGIVVVNSVYPVTEGSSPNVTPVVCPLVCHLFHNSLIHGLFTTFRTGEEP